MKRLALTTVCLAALLISAFAAYAEESVTITYWGWELSLIHI